MSKGKKLTHEDIRQLIHSAPNDKIKKLWEGVLKKLNDDPPRQLEIKPKKPQKPSRGK